MARPPKDMDLHNMTWLISSLDMAIYGNPVRLDYIEKILKNYEKKYEGINYLKISNSLKSIEKIMLEKVYTVKTRRKLKFLNYGTRSFLIAAIAIAFITLFLKMNYLIIIFYILFIISVLMLIINFLMLRSLDKIIEKMDDLDFLKEKEYIISVNQYLIDILSKKMKEKNANPRDYRIPLKSEYKNLEIVSRSNFMRKYYNGIIKIQP
ncbi:MAG: hypothetical protein QW754_04825 [Thermoplasmata archaeon]